MPVRGCRARGRRHRGARGRVVEGEASPNPSGGQDVLNEVGRLPGTQALSAVGRTNSPTPDSSGSFPTGVVAFSQTARPRWGIELPRDSVRLR
jgi:hypothetical protein